ncbi:MAG: relaxase/mobilization nuclease domain-containing protein [Pseudomonadota bacterium]
MAENVTDAFEESCIFSQGTKCKQHLFSVSFNPPKNAKVTTEDFENAIAQCAEKMGLQNQPHVIVFHEKEGRRHAHAVWCRIDAENMKAVQLSYYKNKMAELSKNLYLEHNWQLPQGHLDRAKRNPLNFSLYEWQQTKRLKVDPRVMKQALQNCWQTSDSKKAFEQALAEHGYTLARGDRRGYVAVDWRGEIISLSRWLNVKKKDLKARLGKHEDLPDIETVKNTIDKTLVERVNDFDMQIRAFYQRRLAPMDAARQSMVKRHKQQRAELEERQQDRLSQEQRQRATRHAQGWRGLWHRVTGKYKEIEKRNERETYDTYKRDQQQRDILIFRQMQERQNLQIRMDKTHQTMHKDLQDMRQAVFSKLRDGRLRTFENKVKPHHPQPGQGFGLEM